MSLLKPDELHSYPKGRPVVGAPGRKLWDWEVATLRVSQVPFSLRAPRPAGFDKAQHEAHCRMCLRHKRVRALTQHHLVPLRWWKGIGLEWRGVRNAPNNIIPLCRPCHDLVEAVDRSVREPARRMCRRSMVQAEIAFAIAVRGKDWFDEHYPP